MDVIGVAGRLLQLMGKDGAGVVVGWGGARWDLAGTLAQTSVITSQKHPSVAKGKQRVTNGKHMLHLCQVDAKFLAKSCKICAKKACNVRTQPSM